MPKSLKKNSNIFYIVLVSVGLALCFSLALLLIFSLIFRDKIFFGIKANGVDIGGKTKQQALQTLNQKTEAYMQNPITIGDGDNSRQIYPAEIELSYANQQLVDRVYSLTNNGNVLVSVANELFMLFGLKNKFYDFSYKNSLLADRLVSLPIEEDTKVENASFVIEDDKLKLKPENQGTRVDLGRLIYSIEENLANLNSQIINPPEYRLKPAITGESLANTQSQIQKYIEKPLVLSYAKQSFYPDKPTILSWVNLSADVVSDVERRDLMGLLAQKNLDFSSSISPQAISDYLTSFSDQINREPKNAGLKFGPSLSVTSPSQNGQSLNINLSVKEIIDSLNKDSDAEGRKVALVVDVKRPDVREDNLSSLGINELIGEGVTYFPGSPPNRLINVRIGANRFNGIILKPNEVFSFGELLGPVGPEQGYTPGLVILENHEEKQYGGGMCQVSSTAFRAALLAGLPILERHNHAFAVSYYTAPYGVPGVDATIYYPPVDFKFKNDTGAFLLIQTHMEGATLKFDFFGTKTKSGQIRGPEFISGSNDVNQPSHTVFYRDVVDLSGKVTKTDTFHTYYRPATDFPITGD
jgi:vancomycin resistance protein YoaR